jgi:hypothetical protein
MGGLDQADQQDSLRCGAAMKQPIQSIVEAELCALANALTVAHRHGLLARGSLVMLQSDSICALAIIRGKIPDVEDRPAAAGLSVTPVKRLAPTRLHLAAIAVLRDIVAVRRLSLVTRHVRAHRSGSGRQWVNGEVDRIARAAMRERRRLVAATADAVT